MILDLIAASLETTNRGEEHKETGRGKRKEEKKSAFLGGKESLANLLSPADLRSQLLNQRPVKMSPSLM